MGNASFKRNNKGNLHDDSNILSVFHGTDAFLLEDELNESQWSQVEARAELMRAQYTSGILSDFNLVQVDTNNSYLESIDGKPLNVLVDGYMIKVGGNDSTNPLSKDSRLLFDTTPENGTDEADNLHYLEFWFEVVNYSQTLRKFGGSDTAILTNTLLDSRISTETSRRVQMKWKRTWAGKPSIFLSSYTSMGDNLYKKTAAPTYDANGNLLNPGVTYAIIFANGTHSTQGNPVVHNEAKAKLKSNNVRKDITQADNIMLNDVNNNFESSNVATALDEAITATNISEEARAGVLRQTTHSGILDLNTGFYIDEARTFNGGFYVNYTNSFWNRSINVGRFKALINGYSLEIAGFNPSANVVSRIFLPASPTYGTRHDLVFLEAFWTMKKPGDTIYKFNGVGNSVDRTATTYEKVMEWRIRTVAGVDFNRFKEGIGYSNNIGVSAQGGNTTLPKADIYTAPTTAESGTYLFYSSTDRLNTSIAGKKVQLNDVGLYIAGDGTQASKDALKTIDGYVYAIPLFKVRRRNTEGYKTDNVHGARVYYKLDLNESTNPAVAAMTQNSSATITVKSDVDLTPVRVGDIVTSSLGSGWLYKAEITKINTSTRQVTIRFIEGNSNNNPMYVDNDPQLLSDRPDGKFAGFVYEDDIHELRHKVSSKEMNYQQILEENMDKLLRGNLNVKDKPKMAKETFGLSKAPKNIQSQLMPKRIVGNDGVERNLINLLGSKGNIDSDSNADGLADLFNSKGSGISSVSLDSSRSSDSSKSQRLIKTATNAGNAYVTIPFKFEAGKYYLIGADMISSIDVGTNLTVKDSGLTTQYHVYKSDLTTLSSKFSFVYVKMEGNVNAASIVFDMKVAPAYDLWISKVRLYEVDKATYDKIDVDASFIGEELAKKYPYVNSYSNTIAFRVPQDVTSWEQGTFNEAAPLASTTRIRTINFIPILSNTNKITFQVDPVYNLVARFYSDKIESSLIADTNWQVSGYSYVVPTNARYVKFSIRNTSNTTINPNEISIAKANIVEIENYINPYDYANSDTVTRLVDYQGDSQRRTWSDKQVSETVTDIISPYSNSHLSHVSTTQATAGQWTVGDTITIRHREGIITGVIDSNTAVAYMLRTGDNTNTGYFDNVTGFAVGDTVRFYRISDNYPSTVELSITAIDTTNKTITFSSYIPPSYLGLQTIIVETTTSTSTPAVTSPSIAGTWSKLATKEVVYTITTAPAPYNSLIKIDYSLNYPIGNGMANLPTEVFETAVNHDRHIKSNDGIVKIKANFETKIKGNTDLNPHTFKWETQSNLAKSPKNVTYEPLQTSINKLTRLDNTLTNECIASADQTLAQQVFSFDIVRMIEDKFGENVFGDCLTLDDKVAKAKTLVSKMTFNWWGFGSGPNGNKANVAQWYIQGSAWNNIAYHTNGTVTKISSVRTGPGVDRIDTNGLVYFTAYTELASSTTSATIYTDFVELELEINVLEAGYDMFIPENPYPILVDDVKRFREGENILPPFTDGKWKFGATPTVYTGPYKISQTITSVVNEWNKISDIIPEKNANYTISFKGNMRVVVILYDAKGVELTRPLNYWSEGTYTFTTTADTEKMDIAFTTQNLAANTICTVENAVLTRGTTATFSPYRKNSKRRLRFNYVGKIAGSTFENPHRMFTKIYSNIEPPSLFMSSEMTQESYDLVVNPDGQLSRGTSTTDGYYAQRLFEFDLSHLGLSLTELKAALRRLSVNWVGFGQGNNNGTLAYGATLKMWNNDSNAWSSGTSTTNTTSVPSSILTSPNTPNYIGRDQKVYVMVHTTYPGSTAITGLLSTDYISLEVDLADYVDYVKSNVVKIQKETKELKLQYPKRSYRTNVEDVIDIYYKVTPYQGVGRNYGNVLAMDNKLTVLTYGTGKNSQSSTPYRNASTRLPKNGDTYKDYQLFEDALVSNAIGIDSRLMTYPINFGSKGYGLTSVYYTSALDGMTVSSRERLPFMIPHLTIVSYLTVTNGEIRMKIKTGFSNGNTISNDGTDIDDYYIEGRPLIKDI